ncbi:hypothetical protein ACJJTC_000047 [Scirpophaga incertulas]
MDTKGEGEEMTYPHICFMVDNFDEVFCDIVVRDGEMVCVELVASGRGGAAQAVIFLGSIRYDALTRVYESRQTSLSTKVAQRMSFGLLGRGGAAAARCEFVRMKGPAGKGHAEVAVSRPRAAGLDTPCSEPGAPAADLWDPDWDDDPEDMFVYRHQRRLSDPSANLSAYACGGWRARERDRDRARSEDAALDLHAEVEAGDLRDGTCTGRPCTCTPRRRRGTCGTVRAQGGPAPARRGGGGGPAGRYVHRAALHLHAEAEAGDLRDGTCTGRPCTCTPRRRRGTCGTVRAQGGPAPARRGGGGGPAGRYVHRAALHLHAEAEAGGPAGRYVHRAALHLHAEAEAGDLRDGTCTGRPCTCTPRRRRGTCGTVRAQGGPAPARRGGGGGPAGRYVHRAALHLHAEAEAGDLRDGTAALHLHAEAEAGDLRDGRYVHRAALHLHAEAEAGDLRDGTCTGRPCTCTPRRRRGTCGTVRAQGGPAPARRGGGGGPAGRYVHRAALHLQTEAEAGDLRDGTCTGRPCTCTLRDYLDTALSAAPRAGRPHRGPRVVRGREEVPALPALPDLPALPALPTLPAPRSRLTADGTLVNYWCDLPDDELDDGLCREVWARRGFSQTYLLWKEGRRQRCAPLAAALASVTLPWWAIAQGGSHTYLLWKEGRRQRCAPLAAALASVTLPWWAIAQDILDHREEPILTF